MTESQKWGFLLKMHRYV